MQINDKRKISLRPLGFVLARDDFMSGWGKCERGKSYYCLAYDTEAERLQLLENMKIRDEFRRVRDVSADDNGNPIFHGGPRDHLSVRDRGVARNWYLPDFGRTS